MGGGLFLEVGEGRLVSSGSRVCGQVQGQLIQGQVPPFSLQLRMLRPREGLECAL